MNTQTVTLDVTKRRQVMPEIRIGQGDKDGTTLVANIYDNGEPFTLTNYSVRFAMKLPFDMAYWSVGGTVSGNTATFAIDESYAASVAGVTETAYVEVLSGSTVICSTNRIRVVCLESAYENVDPAHLWDNGVEQFLEEAQDTLDATVAQAQSDVSDAVDDADAATTRAVEAAEAAEGVILDAVPTMSPTLKGGAKLGSGLEVVSDTLSIDLTDAATGESVTAADASYLASLTVDGKAVQDGTPTPSAPVDVQVVRSVNLWDEVAEVGYINTTTGQNDDSNTTRYRSKNYIPVSPGTEYYFKHSVHAGSSVIYRLFFYAADKTFISSPNGTYTSGTFTTPNNCYYVRFFVNEALTNFDNMICVNLSNSAINGTYYAYNSIALRVGSTITPIDLQGNVLASLPDGTKDVLTVDSVGHVVLEKRVDSVDLGDYNWSESGYGDTLYFYTAGITTKKAGNFNLICDRYITSPGAAASQMPNFSIKGNANNSNVSVRDYSYNDTASFKAGVQGALVYFELATPQTIDLGYIDMPIIPDGAAISITAQVTPTITASWWARGAAAIAEALKAVRARINAIEAAIAELATA